MINTSQVVVVCATKESKARKGDIDHCWGWVLFNTDEMILGQRFGRSVRVNHLVT